MQAALPPLGIDAMVQTDDLLLRDGSCQTDQLKEIDFPIQADLQSEMEAVSTIKEENMEVVFRVPTEDSSSDSFSDDTSSDDDSRDSEDIKSSNDLENSEFYKIYCRYEDPKNAIEKIKELKNCLSVHEPQQNQDVESFIESENQFQLETGVKTIWRFFGLTTIPNKDFSPDLNAIKSFINDPSCEYLEYDKILDAFKLISQCCTTIKMIQPYGYECWIVKDFEKGPEISKWYHGQAIDVSTAEKLAFLNLAGIKIPEVGEKGRIWQQWTEFARRLASDQGIIFIHITWIMLMVHELYMSGWFECIFMNIVKQV